MYAHKIVPTIFQPFSQKKLRPIQAHIKEVRRCFDWPGVPYHDANEPDEKKFNRWYWHNLPMLKAIHNDRGFINRASLIFGQPVKPSYVFLSMYGPEGVCPLHTDRPQCQFTIDLCINSDGVWPIYVDGEAYFSKPGDALAYSGTGQPHYRKPMKDDSFIQMPGGGLVGNSEEGKRAKFMDLAFFHFVPTDWQGSLG